MEFDNQIDNFQEQVERPSFLKVLCILSWISTGIGIISGFFNLITGPFSEEEMLDQKVEMIKSIDELRTMGADQFANIFEQLQRMTEAMNSQFYYVQIVSLLVVALGVFGIYKMWTRSKLGFHLYIIYSLLSVLTVYLFVAPEDVPSIVVIINLVISAIFVFMYSRNLKWMK